MDSRGSMDMDGKMQQKGFSVRRLQDFTSAVNPLGPSRKAKNVLRRHLKDLEFPDNQSYHLLNLLAKNEHIDGEMLMLRHGSTDLLHTVLHVCKPSRVFVPAPVSQGYRQVISRAGATLHEERLGQDELFSMSLPRLIKGMERADAVILPYPHDIVGTHLAIDDLKSIITEADAQRKVLILDESLRDFTTLNSPVDEASQSKYAIIVRTFSLFYALAGLPVGYAIGSASMIGNIKKSALPFRTNTLAIRAAMASLKDRPYGIRTHRFVHEEKKYFMKTLAAINEGVSCIDTTCPFLVLKIEKEENQLKDLFSRYGMLIDTFFCGANNERYLRVPIRNHHWNARFLKTLKNTFGVTKE